MLSTVGIQRFETNIRENREEYELLVKKLTAEKKEKPQPDALSVNYVEEAARELGEKLGRPCRIVNGKKKGRIELEYYGTDDLNALLEALEKLGRK